MMSIIVIIYVILGGVTYCQLYFGSAEKHAAAGQFGDMFGWITSLFSSLTFAGLIYSIVMQRTELNNTVAEMREQTKLNGEQLKTNILIQETNKLQRFENTFFTLLQKMGASRMNVQTFMKNGVNIVLQDAFENALATVNSFLTENGVPFSYHKLKHKAIADKYKAGDQKTLKTLPYYKDFENILYLLFDSDLPLSVQRFYIRLLKSYIEDDNELVLLYYHIAFKMQPDEAFIEKIRQSLLFTDMQFNKFPDSASGITYSDYLFPPDKPIV